MPSDPFRSRTRLRVRALRETCSGLQALRGQLQRELASREQEIIDLTCKLDTLSKVGELFRALMDQLVMGHIRSIEGVVTEGLQTIFVDQKLSFEAEVSQRYNKMAIDLYIKRGTARLDIKGHPLESFGGGPSSIVSLILRILVLRRMKKWPLLALDEALDAISPEYIDQTGIFLKQLAAKIGVSILLVSHTSEFLDHAVIGYRGTEVLNEDGMSCLKLQREHS